MNGSVDAAPGVYRYAMVYNSQLGNQTHVILGWWEIFRLILQISTDPMSKLVRSHKLMEGIDNGQVVQSKSSIR